jgi:phenylpyruvate tautomerase PptA (4-oxalocrotonate tautomerase family)
MAARSDSDVPYLHLDVPRAYPAEAKKRLAKRMGEIYARVMETEATRVRVGFRELAEGSLWHCTEGDPRPAVVLACDIRRGRSAEQRGMLARELIEACREMLELPGEVLVEFTQHAGDEIYREGRGLAEDWNAAEKQAEKVR